MKRLTRIEVEALAARFRQMMDLSQTEPLHIKTVLRKANIFTIYRPLDDDSCGLSLKSKDGKRFILVNSQHNRGRQHFTIAHELYHLYYDIDVVPHLCKQNGAKDTHEHNADFFASTLLMPYEGLVKNIPVEELQQGSISIATILRLEQYFQVSRTALLVRLSYLKFISQKQYEEYRQLPVLGLARQYGYDTSLYESGNENVVLGDYGEKAKILFDREKISEGHYLELMKCLKDE